MTTHLFDSLIVQGSQGSFDYDDFLHYRNTVVPADKYIWGPGNWDFMRLPGNISIFDFLIYQGKLFDLWCTQQGYA